MGRFYLTTPIYYLNGEPHFGHAYTTIATDILARYHRQKGDDVFFLTGTDEHGNKVAQAAAERGLSPRDHVDELSQKFREMTVTVGATADFFMRTTDPGHERFVQSFVQRLYDNGDIEKRSYGGLYCTHCEGFWKEEDLVDGNCPDHGVPPQWLEEENYYFLLSRYQDRLGEFLRAHPDWARPRTRHNEALSFVERGLEDISISRETLTWGVPVPWDSRQVIYVWVDALINYLSALTYAKPGEDLVKRYWPAQVHLMSKDILKFHAVIWPALLMSAGYELPECEFIHGYLLMGGEKMSKTRGNVLDPFAVIAQHGVDPLRFYLMREVTFGVDGAISLEGFEQRYNNELANELGNLVSRSVSMIGKYRGGMVPAADPAAAALAGLRDQGEAMVAHSGERFDAIELTAALEVVWDYVRRLNRYVEEEAPWKLAKDEALAGHLDEVLLGLVAGQRLVALCLYPVIPGTAVEILRRLGQPCGESDLWLDKAVWGGVTVGVAAGQVPPLFPRIETAKG
jgi:methionyl-tRNA synthetase